MSEIYCAMPLPDIWPGERTPPAKRKPSPFRANWGGTLELLARELKAVHATDVTLALDLVLGDIRRDGGVRADARIKDPAVILAFKMGANRLSFPCDRFPHWSDNVHAIVLALEALRKVERYGIQAGRQYEGFKAMGSGDAITPPSRAALMKDLAGYADVTGVQLDLSDESVRGLLRKARAKHHPDAGGSHERFTRIGELARGLGL